MVCLCFAESAASCFICPVFSNMDLHASHGKPRRSYSDTFLRGIYNIKFHLPDFAGRCIPALADNLLKGIELCCTINIERDEGMETQHLLVSESKNNSVIGTIKKYFEGFFLLAFSLIWIVGVVFFKFPVPTPSGYGAFNHYVLPLIAALLIQMIVAAVCRVFKLSSKGLSMKENLIALLYIPLIAFTVFLHFSFKVWMPLANSTTYDGLYYQIDKFTPIESWLSKVGFMLDVSGACSVLYFLLFVGMFMMSFIAHATFDVFLNFRKVVVGTCVVLLLGGVSYWIMPAVGPFIIEPSKLSGFSATQTGMYDLYLKLVETKTLPVGYFAAAPAAMPSLHIANSLFFLLSAKRSLPRLAAAYVPVFAFFVIVAVASKWHYVIDLIFGAMLSVIALKIVDWAYGYSENFAVR